MDCHNFHNKDLNPPRLLDSMMIMQKSASWTDLNIYIYMRAWMGLGVDYIPVKSCKYVPFMIQPMILLGNNIYTPSSLEGLFYQLHGHVDPIYLPLLPKCPLSNWKNEWINKQKEHRNRFSYSKIFWQFQRKKMDWNKLILDPMLQ